MFKNYFDKKKLVVFDLDGTIIKSEGVWDLAFKEVAKLHGLELMDTGVSGNPVSDRWKQIINDSALDLKPTVPNLVELTHDAFIRNLDKVSLTEGFWPFVAELKSSKKLNLALVTNTARVVVDKVIAHFELGEVFDFVICGDEVKKTKPDPEIYKKTLQHFKIKAKEALAFEDSLTGSISASKAGIKILLIWDGETPQRKFPDEVLDYPADFTPFPGNMDTTYYEDILQMVKEQEQKK